MWFLLPSLLLSSVLSRHLYVHLTPHSHEDLGWLKTVDEYFYGANQTIYQAGVQYILDSVVRELALDPAKRFTYVEAGFFYRWWREQTPSIQSAVKRLVANRQLQFANGGWVMHDEAATTFEDQLDQMAFGHKFLLETFGVKPTIGWQIDPFGHSEANADLYAKMGFNGLFFARIDYQDKAQRLNESTLEMIWRPETGTGYPGELFTHVLYAHYSFPSGFCWDQKCLDDPVMDDPTLENYNAQEIASGFASWVTEMSQSYRTDHLFVCMGDDFTYQNAAMVYKNMDKLIALVNSNSTYNMTLIYSTPEEYLEAVYALNQTWPLKKDDFFPYADGVYSYWTGYFTSRTTLKGMIKTFGSRMRAALDLLSISSLTHILNDTQFPALRAAISKLQAPMSVAQHHDAITGTEKQHVTFDYQKMLAAGSIASDSALNFMMDSQARESLPRPTNFTQCILANETICEVTHNFNFGADSYVLLAVLNPTYHNITDIVKIPVSRGALAVFNYNNNLAEYDIVENYYTPRISENNYTIYLRVSAGPMETVYFLIESVPESPIVTFSSCEKNCVLANDLYKLQFIGNYLGSSLWEFERISSLDMTILNVTLGYYAGSVGDSVSSQASGAYIFRPDSFRTPQPKKYADFLSLWMAQGTVVDLGVMAYGEAGFQVVVLPKGTTDLSVRVETWLNSISLAGYTGKEIVILYTTSLYNNQTFYTDSNGMGMIQRVWNYRPTWELNYTNEPQSCNYYPVTSAIYFTDLFSEARFTVVTDRAEGGTSPNYAAGSSIELMIHRRLLMDDGRGVGEALNEPDPYDPSIGLRAILTHKLLFANSDAEQRIAEETLWHHPQVFLTHYDSEFQGGVLRKALWKSAPTSFQVNFRPFSVSQYVLRLRNMLGVAQSFELSEFLSPIAKVEVTEAGLTENQSMEDVFANHLHWNIDNEPSRPRSGDVLSSTQLPGTNVTLQFNPGQVRSFFLQIGSTVSIHAD